MGMFYKTIKKNVFPCDFGHSFWDEICIVLNTHWILRNSLQFYRIVIGLIGDLWLDRRWKTINLRRVFPSTINKLDFTTNKFDNTHQLNNSTMTIHMSPKLVLKIRIRIEISTIIDCVIITTQNFSSWMCKTHW